jgi:hypothetical protein
MVISFQDSAPRSISEGEGHHIGEKRRRHFRLKDIDRDQSVKESFDGLARRHGERGSGEHL